MLNIIVVKSSVLQTRSAANSSAFSVMPHPMMIWLSASASQNASTDYRSKLLSVVKVT